jgi:hypothetical protein
MKSSKFTLKSFMAFMVVFMPIQIGALLLFYHVFHWGFFLSEVLAALLPAYPALWVQIAVNKSEN